MIRSSAMKQLICLLTHSEIFMKDVLKDDLTRVNGQGVILQFQANKQKKNTTNTYLMVSETEKLISSSHFTSLKQFHFSYRCIRWHMFFKMGVFKNFANFTGKQVEICEILKNIFFTEHLRWLFPQLTFNLPSGSPLKKNKFLVGKQLSISLFCFQIFHVCIEMLVTQGF